MRFSSTHGRRFLAVMAGALYALALIGNVAPARASILLPCDLAAVYDVDGVRAGVDLSISHPSASRQSNRHSILAANQDRHASNAKRTAKLLLYKASDGLLGASSSPTHVKTTSARAAIILANPLSSATSPSIPRLIASIALALPEPLPASLLRPPQSASAPFSE